MPAASRASRFAFCRSRSADRQPSHRLRPGAASYPPTEYTRDKDGRLVATAKVPAFSHKIPRCEACGGGGTVGNANRERAEFIRVQCELAKTDTEKRGWSFFDGTSDDAAERAVRDENPAVERLRRRERELWTALTGRGVFDGLPAERCTVAGVDPPDLYPSETYTVRRGFVHTVRCRLADWIGGECVECQVNGLNLSDGGLLACPSCSGTGRSLGIGPRVVAAHPVEVVRVTDREPANGGTGWGRPWHWTWSNPAAGDEPRSSDLPPELYDLCGDNYLTEEAADAALSAALIAWARSAAP